MGQCDRCPQQAQYEWVHPDGRVLAACGHHNREWAPILLEQGWIQRQRWSLPPLTSDPATH